MGFDFTEVTEVSGEPVSLEQVGRIAHRYMWASKFSSGKDILEVACGSGQGLELLSKTAKSLQAGDFSDALVAKCKEEYGAGLDIRQFDAQKIPFNDESFDVIILFEALYYIPSAGLFVEEAKRLLRPRGCVLIATANKDLCNTPRLCHFALGVQGLHLVSNL